MGRGPGPRAVAPLAPRAPREGPAHAFAHAPGSLAWFGGFRAHAATRRIILAIDAVGVLYGFYYYAQYRQFELTPAALWPFVPDSPLAVLWAFLALILLEFGRRSRALEGLAVVGNIQVGLWTCYVLAANWDTMGSPLNAVLWVAHLGMAAHALLFVDALRADWREGRRAWVLVPAAFYLVNDALDYFLTSVTYPARAGCVGISPITIPCNDGYATLAVVTFGLTVLGLLVAVVPGMLRSRRGPA